MGTGTETETGRNRWKWWAARMMFEKRWSLGAVFGLVAASHVPLMHGR